MAISRDKKQQLVKELGQLISDAKAVATATYDGTTVESMQELRKLARENQVTIKVVKNRLLKVALDQDERFKDADLSNLKGQLIYAFSNEDEVAPAQILAKFAKTQSNIELVAGLSGDGKVLDTATVKALATLPTKDQLRGQMVSVVAAPLTQLLGVANGAQRGLAQVLAQRAEQI